MSLLKIYSSGDFQNNGYAPISPQLHPGTRHQTAASKRHRTAPASGNNLAALAHSRGDPDIRYTADTDSHYL